MKLTPDQVRAYLKARQALIRQSRDIAEERQLIFKEIKVTPLIKILCHDAARSNRDTPYRLLSSAGN